MAVDRSCRIGRGGHAKRLPASPASRGCGAQRFHGAACLYDRLWSDERMGSEIVARALVLRLIELLGGNAPDWHEDSSVFPPAVINRIVEYIDSHMHRHIGLVEIASLVGLSPSHCARKFRRTGGLSLERFVNRRRLIKALDLLRSSSVPLARVALDLGFCSQSHFTRLFSGQTGLTPAKYRRQFRPIVG
jgi:AraC family transcriptional regulator